MEEAKRKKVSLKWGLSVAGVLACFCGVLIHFWPNSLIEGEFAVFAPDEKASSVKALSKVLGAGKTHSVQISASLREALDADTEVIVIFMEGDYDLLVEPADIAELRERKVIGVGHGAGRLFGRLGLEIDSSAGNHSSDRAPEITIETDVGGPELKGQSITAYRAGEPFDWYVVRQVRRLLGLSKASTGGPRSFAMFLPPEHELTQYVTALSRKTLDENYAPIVKQGNFILVGLSASLGDWTKEYKGLFADIAGALAAEAKVPFVEVEWEPTLPGEYDFELASGGSTTDLSGRTFHFNFEEATNFKATLEYSGSSNVMVLFMTEGRSDWIRKDATRGEGIDIQAEITQEQIEQLEDGRGILKVVNFDRSGPATCKVVIEY